MSLILNIETATQVCSVALADGEEVLGFKETKDQNVHSKELTVYIESLFKETGKNIKDLNAVAVSKGPGSYTGLRIGVSVAKGICYALNIPLISVSTLQAMALGFIKNHEIEVNSLLCPMIDARRMEVYTAFYNTDIEELKPISADIIDSNSYINELNKQHIYFFGDGSEKCKEIINHPSAEFVPKIDPSALNMVNLSYNKFVKKTFEDTAYFEPFYLKDFIATIPKKNIFK